MAGTWRGNLVRIGSVGAAIGAGFTLGSLVTQQAMGLPTVAAPQPESPSPTFSTGLSTGRPNPAAVFGPNFIADAAEKISPAVVRIDTVTVRQVRGGGGMELFPEIPGLGGGGNRTPRQFRDRGAGSGFVLSSDGTIVTNAHVVEGADKVTVTLNDGRKVAGKVLGVDPLTDVAVVKVTSDTPLPTVNLGDSDKLRPGEWVIALGNPLGLDHTVTAGIISALNRQSSDVGVRGDKRIDFIQTDAAINPGNSGGPLINIYGQVIGVNTAIRADGQGIGFAIPINKVREVADTLIKFGRVRRPYVGVSMVSITPDLLETLRENPNSGPLPDADKGVWVRQVVDGSPAAKAGLRGLDVIVEVDGQPVTDAKQVQDLIGAHKPGETVRLKVKRSEKTLTFNVKTVEYGETSNG